MKSKSVNLPQEVRNSFQFSHRFCCKPEFIINMYLFAVTLFYCLQMPLHTDLMKEGTK